MEFLLIIVFLLNCLKPCRTMEQECVYVDYFGKELDVSDVGCPNNSICNHTFIVSYMSQMKAYISSRPIEKLLQQCCGSCTQINYLQNFTDITEISSSSIHSSEFIFPLLGKQSAVTLYGYHFIPYIDLPGAIYITRDEDIPVLSSIIDLYPLIIISLLMTVISGFFAWITETWKNSEEFPRPFLSGWYEGFWWSFVSMTTVGYGDKTPKSFCGRIFAIVWILIGIISCAILTASLTSEILKANNSPLPDMKDENVGVLKFRNFEGYIVAKHGGYAIETDGSDFIVDILQLISKLRRKEIHGFLLDKYTLWYVNYLMIDMSGQAKDLDFKDDINFFLQETIRTEKEYKGPNLSYGILVKYKAHYDYLLRVTEDNHFNLKRYAAEMWTKEEQNVTYFKRGNFYSSSSILFSPSKQCFQYSLIFTVSILALICLFGVFYEIQRKLKEEKAFYRDPNLDS